jgi:hypothetical protein
MKSDHTIYYPANNSQFASAQFEEALYDSMLRYSLQHLKAIGNVSQENILYSLKKSLQICSLLGINSKYHFKQIYVFDAEIDILKIEWLMSKKGFNLMIMQISPMNENMARWLWELTDNVDQTKF